MPSKEDWLGLFASCKADTTLKSGGNYYGNVGGLASCMTGKGFPISSNYYWSSSQTSGHAWNASFSSNDYWNMNWAYMDYSAFIRCAQ
jgi:hypothetical protein